MAAATYDPTTFNSTAAERSYSAEFDCRMQNAEIARMCEAFYAFDPQVSRVRSSASTSVWGLLYARTRIVSKVLRCASPQGDAFTALPHFDFRLRLQLCSPCPSLQNRSPKRLHFRVRVRLQNSEPCAVWKVKCETSLQNAECRTRRGQEIEAGDFEFKFRLRLQRRF